MKERIYRCIVNGIENYNESSENKIDYSDKEKTELFSDRGALDSLGLVNLILSVEEELSSEFNVSVSLASEKAMSQKVSPFKSIETLQNYIAELIYQEKG
jgi:D-alanine--poly(phosphoribitol) ligase subunit 2